MRYRGNRCLVILAVLALAGAAQARGESPIQKTTAEGLAIELSVQPLESPAGPLREGRPARVRLAITDALSGAPLSRLYPGAWMDLLDDPLAGEKHDDCKQKVESFVGGSILSRPELDLTPTTS